MRKNIALALVCCLLSTVLLPGLTYAEEQSAIMPNIYFDYCSIGTVNDKTGSDGSPYHSLINDLFYIEYPGSWNFDSTVVRPIVFYNEDTIQKIIPSENAKFFEDINLIGTEDDIDRYVKDGGINSYLNQVLGITDLSGYTFVTQGDSSLVYTLEKDGDAIAYIVIWTATGTLFIQDERLGILFDPVKDTGYITIFPVWKNQDFSSIEAIQTFVDGGNLNVYMEPCVGPVTWTTKTYETENHQYLLCEGITDKIKTTVYIPVISSEMKKWIVGFDVYKESQDTTNAYLIQEVIIKTFKVLK